LDDPVGYIAGDGSDNRILFGAFMERLLIIANIGTAVVLFPILRRQSEIFALGYVTARVVECTFLAIGLFAVLTVVTLGQEAAGLDEGAFGPVGYALAALKDWTFILGPGFVVGVGNELILGNLMYQSGLVPRPLAVLGLIGGPLICASGVAVLFDVSDQGGTGRASRPSRSSFGSWGSGSGSPSRDSDRLRSSRGNEPAPRPADVLIAGQLPPSRWVRLGISASLPASAG
jgi:hypothetical protein